MLTGEGQSIWRSTACRDMGLDTQKQEQKAPSGREGKAKDNLCLHYNITSCPPLRRKMKGKACLTVAFVHFMTKSKASSSQGWSGPPSVVGVRILFSDLQIQ